MRNTSNETVAVNLSWTKRAGGWWQAEHRGYKLQVCEEKLPMHPPAFLVYIDGQRIGQPHKTLQGAQAHAATLID